MCENYNVITEICESSQNADSSMRIFCLFYNFQLKKPTLYNFLHVHLKNVHISLSNTSLSYNVKSCKRIVEALPQYWSGLIARMVGPGLGLNMQGCFRFETSIFRGGKIFE